MAFGPVVNRATRAWIALAALAVVLGACGGPQYHYVKSSSEKTFVRVPNDWKLFDEDDLLAISEESPEAKAQFKALSWSVAFDAAPKPSIDHLLTDAGHPAGLVQVRRLPPPQRDTFSLAELRSLYLGFDPLAGDLGDTGDVEVLEAKEVTRPGGFHGSELLLNLRTESGKLMKWRQVALLDSQARKVHVLVISCNIDCYAAHEDEIDKVVKSLQVKER